MGAYAALQTTLLPLEEFDAFCVSNFIDFIGQHHQWIVTQANPSYHLEG